MRHNEVYQEDEIISKNISVRGQRLENSHRIKYWIDDVGAYE
jgi:hypothetical protein